MRKKWILIGLAVGLLTVVITGGVALAWGGPGYGWTRGGDDGRLSALAGKVAGILETDEQETADAIAQARQELRDEAQEEALQDIAGRVAEALGTDADDTADAISQVAEEMRSEKLEAKLQDAIDNGDMTEDEAQEIRDSFSENGWRGRGSLVKGDDFDDFATRVGALLEVDGEAVSGDDVADAINQAMSDIRSEALEEKLQAAIDNGKLTEDEADEIREKIESGEHKGFDKRGRHGRHGGKGIGGRGRGHHGRHGSGSEPTATPEPASDGDSA